MKAVSKYFVEERFRMMPMPYWWQFFKWIKYAWRKMRYMAWKRRGKIFKRCIICQTKAINGNNYCKNCKTDYNNWLIESVDELQYIQLLEKISKTKVLDNRTILDKSLAQALEKSSLQPLENSLKGIGEIHQVKWKPIREELKAKLMSRFTKFPIITRKDIAEYRRDNPIS